MVLLPSDAIYPRNENLKANYTHATVWVSLGADSEAKITYYSRSLEKEGHLNHPYGKEKKEAGLD